MSNIGVIDNNMKARIIYDAPHSLPALLLLLTEQDKQ